MMLARFQSRSSSTHYTRSVISSPVSSTAFLLVLTNFVAGAASAPAREALIQSIVTADYPGTVPSFVPEDVVKDGALVGAWKMCNVSDVSMSSASAAGCRVEKDYTDRISFAFEAKPATSSNSSSLKPSVTSSGGVARPTIIGFVFDRNTGQGSFSVLYNCDREGAESEVFSSIRLSVATVKRPLFALRWGKICKSGVNKLIDLSYEATSGRSVSFYDETGLASSLVVPPTASLTQLLLKVNAPATYQQFQAATVVSSQPKTVSVLVRGSSGNGTLVQGVPTILSVMYECRRLGKATIDVRVPVPPWHDVTASFVKDCGGGVARSVSVGTSAGTADIVNKGIVVHGRPGLRPEMFGDVHGGKGRPVPTIPPDVPASQFKKTFYVRHVGSDDDGPLHFSDVIVSLKEPDIARVLIGGYLSGKDYWHHEADGILRKGSVHPLTLHIICLRAGTASITVSLPLLRYKTVEFTFTKQCAKPSVYKESSIFNVTAIENIMVGVLLFGLSVVVSFILRRWRNLGGLAVSLPRTGGKPRYEPVSGVA